MPNLKNTTRITPLSIKGGVVKVIDSATGDIARTTSGYIEDAKYGWNVVNTATAWSAEFDSDIKYNGKKTLKLATTDVTGRVKAITSSATSQSVSTQKTLIPLSPSTAYKINLYALTNNVALNSVFFQVYMYKSDFTASATANATSNKLSGTTDIGVNDGFSLLTKEFTTNADCAYCLIEVDNVIAGNIGYANFAVDDIEFQTVSSITNSSSSPALFYPTATAVDSTDNIDQSQVATDGSATLGRGLTKGYAQQFLPTKKNITGIVFQKQAEVGTYTGDVTITLRTDNSNTPSTTILATKSYTNVEWLALSNADITALLPYTLTIDGSTKYWITFISSTQDASNYTVLSSKASTGYTGGIAAYSSNGTSWTNDAPKGLYFKTLYEKDCTNLTVSTATQTVSVTAPTVDGWENGTVVNFTDALTLAPGANAIYVSSNGPATADGTVDPSLQATLGGIYGQEDPSAAANSIISGAFYH